MKKNKNKNVPHTHSGQIIASGHNANDTKFLEGNAGKLKRLVNSTT